MRGEVSRRHGSNVPEREGSRTGMNAVTKPHPGGSFTGRKRIRKSFGRLPEVAPMPNLIDVQRASYEAFLQMEASPDARVHAGLQEVFKSVFPIDDFAGRGRLEFVHYHFEEPKYDVEECIQRGMTFAAPLKVTLRLIVFDVDPDTGARSVKDIKEQDVYMGDMPLMTENGTFIVNGTERVIVSQMHRSPGVFFDHDKGKTHSSGKLLFACRIIPYRGSWLDFEFDAKDLVYARIDRRRKIPVTTLLYALGLDQEGIMSAFYDKVDFRLEPRTRQWVTRFFPERVRGTRPPHDLIDAATGEVIVKAGDKVTPRMVKKFIDEGKVTELLVPFQSIQGRYVAEDIIDEETGAIFVEAGDELTMELDRDGELVGGTVKLLLDQGITTFKHFMAYKGALMVNDDEMFASFTRLGELGATALVHAENGDVVAELQRKLLAEGNTGPEAHAYSRPPQVEGEATNRAIMIADMAGVPLYVVHVSCEEAHEAIRRARAQGKRVWGEPLIQHLILDESEYRHPDWDHAARRVMSPPFRDKRHQDSLWAGLQSGSLSVVATDHCAFTTEQKRFGRGDFTKIPNGTGGLEDRMPLLWTHGVNTGRLTPNEFVAVTSANVAKILGCYPRKGAIAVGADADLVVWDPERRKTISAATQQSAIDYNVFEGQEVTGLPRFVLTRGRLAVREGEMRPQEGWGEFVRREARGPVSRALTRWKDLTAPRPVERSGIPASGV